MLLDSPEIYKIESRFSSLFERTIKKGLLNSPGPQIKTSVKRAFSSKTFFIQLDKLIDDIYLYSISETDKLISKALSASLLRSHRKHYLSAADTNTKDTPLILTEEAVRQSEELAVEISESIIEMLKDEAIYKEHPSKLAGRIIDLWNGEKYRAIRFTRTITADIATSTSLHRFKTQGIEKVQFYATIDKRTSSQCRMLHGTVMLADSPEARRYIPPLHPSCRSSILPITIFSEYDKSMEFQNRDFTKPMGQNFKQIDEAMDREAMEKVFKEIDKFKDKYSIPKFVFDEDIEKRLMRLGVGVEAEVPVKAKVPKVKKEPKAKTPKPNKYEVKIIKHQDEIKDLDIQYKALEKEADEINEKLEHMVLDYKNKEAMRAYNEALDKSEEIYGKMEEIRNKQKELENQIYKLKNELEEFNTQKAKIEKEKEFLKNMPKSSHPKAKEIIPKVQDSIDNHERKMAAVYKKRHELLDKRTNFGNHLADKENALVNEINAGKISREFFEAERAKINSEWDKLHDFDNKIIKLEEVKNKLQTKATSRIHKLLYINDGSASKQFIRLGAENEVFRAQQTEEMLDFFNKALTKELREKLPEIDIVELGKGGRAFTTEKTNKVWLGYDSKVDTLIHEIGHNLEFNHSYVRESAYRHLIERTKGETAEKLKDITGNIGYADDEISKKDKFFDPYLGKIYGGTKTTELTSMAIQYLYKDPVYLYKKDPETFEWIVNVIRGHYL